MSTQQLTRPEPTTVPEVEAASGGRLRGLPRPFWIVFAGVIANRIGDMVVPFLVFFLGSRGLSAEQTGLIAMALGTGGLAGPALGGWLADRISHRGALLTGLVATPAALGALYAAPSPGLLAAAAVLLGVFGRIYQPAGTALIIAAVRPDDRPRAVSLAHWAVNIGTAVAASSAGFLAGRGYWVLFLVDAGTCLVFAGIVLAGIPASPRPSKAPGEAGGYSVVLRDRLMLAYTALTFVSGLVYAMTEFAIPLSIRSAGLSPTVFGFAAMANAILVVALQPLLYPSLSRLPRVPVLVGSWTLIAVGVAATGLDHRPWHFVATTVIWSLGEVASGVVGGGIVADLAPAHARGRYQGMFGWAWAAARLGGMTLTTGLLAVAGPGGLWGTVLVLGLGAAAALLRLGAPLRARTGRL